MYFQFVGKIWGHQVSVEIGKPDCIDYTETMDEFVDDDAHEVVELQDVDNGFIN